MSDEGVSPRESATHSDTTVRIAGLMSEKICQVRIPRYLKGIAPMEGWTRACLIRAPLNSVIPFAFALAHFVFHFHSIFTPLPSLRRPRPLPALPTVPTRRPPGGSEGRRTTGRTRKFRCHF